VNGDKKESQRQEQGKAQEDLAHRGDYPQKNHEGQKKNWRLKGSARSSSGRRPQHTPENEKLREARAGPRQTALFAY
jgi:hypothetical protein